MIWLKILHDYYIIGTDIQRHVFGLLDARFFSMDPNEAIPKQLAPI